MDQHRITTLKESFGSLPIRRDVLRGLASAGLGLGGLHLAGTAEAKKRKNKKNKKTQMRPKPVFNQHGCLDIGQPCKGNSALCCSGICQGKKPKKGKKDTSTCVAHNAGICFPDSDSCAVGVPVSCNPNKPKCACHLTTGNAPICADFTNLTNHADICRVCSRDTDCQAEFGMGAACVVFTGACTGACPTTGRTACVVPCAS